MRTGLCTLAWLSGIQVLDWDVHHGNGIEEILYGNPDIMYISLHRCCPPQLPRHACAQASIAPILLTTRVAAPCLGCGVAARQASHSHGCSLSTPPCAQCCPHVQHGSQTVGCSLGSAAEPERITGRHPALLRRGNGFYPGTGDVCDVGERAGRGFNLNIPFPRGGFTDADYVAAFDLVGAAYPASSVPGGLCVHGVWWQPCLGSRCAMQP